ncbi:Uncharacterized protein TCM_039405 [Theobroma cacao]|uniref:Uncharacterized protein n=1 Tax=Theobroma cacao TaxID=3641 RepID=A0A061GS49_THECC|nr:Uncharacterized protein TCM_039405 [Theobroma cacao]
MELKQMVIQFFKSLYEDDGITEAIALNLNWRLDRATIDKLSLPINSEEVRRALFALMVATVWVDCSSLEQDSIYWNLTSSGDFSVKCAYEIQFDVVCLKLVTGKRFGNLNRLAR